MLSISPHGPLGLVNLTYPSPLVPKLPDYAICDRRYGTRLTPLLCGMAANTLMEGDSPVSYTVHDGIPGPYTLPYTAIFGK